MGYAGGDKVNPTYYSLGNHSETIEIVYDPSVISYAELLAVFWYSHSPIYPSGTSQYKSIIFYHNEEQQRLAEESRNALEASLGRTVYTEIIPADIFYPAEDYHQKYYLRQEKQLLAEFQLKYPDIDDFTASTAVARVNGYAGGYGTPEDLERELPLLGLSPASEEIIRELAGHGLSSACPAPGVS